MENFYRTNVYFQAYLRIGLIVCCVALSLLTPSAILAASLNDILSGNEPHDFTAVYHVSVHDKLADETSAQILSQLNQQIDLHDRILAQYNYPPISELQRQQYLKMISGEIQGASQFDNRSIVISVRGNKVLVKMYCLNTKKLYIYLYNGTRCMEGYRGSDTQI
jgi:hypothetical protein